MQGTKQVWSTMKLVFVLVVLLAAQVFGQTGLPSRVPIIGGDGVSREFKLRGPLGVFQLAREPVKVPRAIRALLAPGAKVRLLHKLVSRPEDTLLVYDTSGRPNPLIDIRFPVVLILRSGRAIDRVSLKPRGDDDPDWVFLEAGEIQLSSDLPGIALAFRSMGDGSASLFLVISPDGDRYRIVLRKITGQGRLRTDQNGNLELWDANFGDECVWCDHYYSILTYRWDGPHLARVRKSTSCRGIDPDAMTDKPIEAVQQSMEAEYAESQRKLSQEQRFLRARLPAGLGGVYHGRLGRQEIFLILGPEKSERWNKCDFRDLAEKRGRRYPIVGFYERDAGGERDIDSDVLLAGMPLGARRIRLREYRDHKPTRNVWELSVTRSGVMGVRHITLWRGSTLLRNSTAISLKRLGHEFDPLFPTYADGYDW